MPLTKQYVEDHVRAGTSGDYASFFSKVSPTVQWTVMGHHVLAGTYRSVDEFKQGTLARINQRMQGGKLKLTMTSVLVDGQRAVVELSADSTQLNGRPFNANYAWVLKYDDNNVVEEVRAYVDGVLIDECINENPGP